MHKTFYASGFLYHSASQQILLQQLNSGDEVKFVLFREKSDKGGDPQVVFKQCIEQALGIKIASSSVYPVYDYVHTKLGEHYIFFVDVEEEETPASYARENKTEWLPLSKLSKHPLTEQTRHDIIIAERVIRSIMESARAQQQKQKH